LDLMETGRADGKGGTRGIRGQQGTTALLTGRRQAELELGAGDRRLRPLRILHPEIYAVSLGSGRGGAVEPTGIQ
jgi:hypothetical protein